jgi:hypothetical protein
VSHCSVAMCVALLCSNVRVTERVNMAHFTKLCDKHALMSACIIRLNTSSCTRNLKAFCRLAVLGTRWSIARDKHTHTLSLSLSLSLSIYIYIYIYIYICRSAFLRVHKWVIIPIITIITKKVNSSAIFHIYVIYDIFF